MFVMYDFETLGNTPDSIVVSLGAVAFNRTGFLHEGHWLFDITSQQESRSWNNDTLTWWFKQSEAARSVFWKTDEKKFTLDEFIEHHNNWLVDALTKTGETDDDLKVWGNGANFDIVILEDIYRKAGHQQPWKFWNVWCFRTFNQMTKVKDFIKPAGVMHNALDDAKYQATCVIEVLKGTYKKKR